jgi:hypothetical protein
MCYQRAHIHQTFRNQLNRARIRVLHAPHKLYCQSFSARDRGREGCAIVSRDSRKDHFSTWCDSGDRRIDSLLLPSRFERHIDSPPIRRRSDLT